MTFLGMVLAVIVALILFRVIGWLAPFLFIAFAFGWLGENVNLSLGEVFSIVVVLIAIGIGIYAHVNKITAKEDEPKDLLASQKSDDNDALWKG